MLKSKPLTRPVVFAGLMEIMDDDKLLAIMGHEIGHVVNHDSRDAMKSALNWSAIRNGLSATSGGVDSAVGTGWFCQQYG